MESFFFYSQTAWQAVSAPRSGSVLVPARRGGRGTLRARGRARRGARKTEVPGRPSPSPSPWPSSCTCPPHSSRRAATARSALPGAEARGPGRVGGGWGLRGAVREGVSGIEPRNGSHTPSRADHGACPGVRWPNGGAAVYWQGPREGARGRSVGALIRDRGAVLGVVDCSGRHLGSTRPHRTSCAPTLLVSEAKAKLQKVGRPTQPSSPSS